MEFLVLPTPPRFAQGYLAIDFVGSALMRHGPGSELFGMIVAAWLAGQFVSAGMGLAMGRWPLLVRLGCVIAIAFVLAIPLGSPEASDFGAVFVVMTSAIALPFAIARLIGFRIVPVDSSGESIDPETHRRQFSLMQIFSLMTAVAIVAGLASSGLLKFRGRGPGLGELLLFLIPASLALLTAFSVLGQRGRVFGWSLGLLGLADFAILLIAAMMSEGRAIAEIFKSLLAVQGGIVLAHAPIRLLGYRVSFRRRATPPQTHGATTAPTGNEPA